MIPEPALQQQLPRPALRQRWLNIFKPDPPAPLQLTDPQAVRTAFGSWQLRILVTAITGYAIYYFVRKNLSFAIPAMEHDLGIKKSALGLFLTLHGVLYGISKFVNGFLGDRANARTMMACGLLFSALLNLWFGFSSTVVAFGFLWMLNGWFQGMGFPPCARLLTHWFPPKKLATKMSIWNTSHSIGAGLIAVLATQLVVHNWRLCFIVPACIALVCVVFIWRTLPDTPPSVGLPEVEGTQDRSPEGQESFSVTVMQKVFSNPYIWIVSIANFFVYILRYAIFDWGPSLLTEVKHIHITHAGWMLFAFEFSGLLGALLAGWMTDKFFKGRGARACVFYMLLAGLSIFLFWKNPYSSELLNTALLCLAGFFIYGPQCLIGIIAANLATKKAAASAVGLTGLFAYASTIVSGWGLGTLVEHRGWDTGFAGMLVVAGIGLLLFVATWNARAHGYSNAEAPTVPSR
jgi:OPA family glycerol-3-phosphate transporter-like MFS transporter/OPA family sugar phosphate sensor protein UhpC-like MFS transporter